MNKCVAILFFVFSVNAYSQCSGSVIGYFPATVDGVTVSQTYTGDIQISSSYTYCGVVAGPSLLGGSALTGSPFTQTLSFSGPVNNIIYILNASDSSSSAVETFTFTVNSGILSCIQGGSSCLYTQLGNVFRANSTPNYNGHGNAAYITLTANTPYTSITVFGNGGANGSFMAICSGTANEIKNNTIDEYLKIYPNPAVTILNISYSLQFTAYSLQVYNALGNIVKMQELKNEDEKVDISNLTDGVYLYRIISNNQILKSGKIVIIK